MDGTEIIHLADLRPGEQARICGFAPGDRDYRLRLLAMGLTPHTVFTMVRKAPIGDPIQIQIRSYDLTLRAKEAEMLLLERVNHE